RQAIDVIEVMVADECVRQHAAVCERRLHGFRNVPRRIDDRGLFDPRSADQIDEILHRPELQLPHVERHQCITSGRCAITPANRSAIRRTSTSPPPTSATCPPSRTPIQPRALPSTYCIL